MTRHETFFRDQHALDRRDASARPSSWNADTQTIDCVVATGSPVTRQDQRGSYAEILAVTPDAVDLAEFTGAHVLNGHAQGSVENVIGTVVRARIESDELIATVRFSARPELAGIVNDVAQGIIRGVSVGYEVEAWADGETDGKRTRTAIKWRPREISFVCVGADPRARTRAQGDSEVALRNCEIRELGNRCGMNRDRVDAIIDSGTSVEQARQEMLDHMLARSHVEIRTGQNHQGLANPVEFIRAAGEGLYARVNSAHTPSGPARQFAQMNMVEIAAHCLRRSGESVAALMPAAIIQRSLHTTSDFSAILGDAVGRVLRETYKAAPSGLRRLARQTTLPDFRERAAVVLDPTSFNLERVNEHGEFKSGTFVEGAEKFKLETFGKIFGITRQALVNDDLGALSDIPAKLGAQAAAFEADYLADLLQSGSGLGPTFEDGNPLFDADHGNLANPGAALSDASLSAARLAMRKQTGPAGNLIDIVPRYLIVPPELETTAEKLLATISPSAVGDANPWSFLTLIVEPRLESATAWYLAAETPLSGLTVAYLTGAEGPQVETQAGWRIDGMETKVRLDFVAAFTDWRGIYRNDGTA